MLAFIMGGGTGGGDNAGSTLLPSFALSSYQAFSDQHFPFYG